MASKVVADVRSMETHSVFVRNEIEYSIERQNIALEALPVIRIYEKIG